MRSRMCGVAVILAVCWTSWTFADAPPPATQPAPPPATQPVRKPATPPTTRPATAPATRPIAPPAAAQIPNDPRLEVSPAKFDFGDVWVRQPAKREITIKNMSDEALTLSARSSCGCTVPTQPKTPLAPGESTTISIEYRTDRPGAAHKNVTLWTQDNPAKQLFTIPVEGTVKPLFDMKPMDLNFNAVMLEAEESRTIRMENRFPRPLNLKLKEGQSFGRFQVELTTVEEGKIYELKATTLPPLQIGMNVAQVELLTGIDEVPSLMVPLSASGQPRVSVVPGSIFLSQAATQPSTSTFSVQYMQDKPIKILEVKPSDESIKCEVLPPPATPVGAKYGTLTVRVTLPPFGDVPDNAQITVLTDDVQYKELVVKVVKRVKPTKGPIATPAGPARPGATPSSQPASSDPGVRRPAPPTPTTRPATPTPTTQPVTPAPAKPAEPAKPVDPAPTTQPGK